MAWKTRRRQRHSALTKALGVQTTPQSTPDAGYPCPFARMLGPVRSGDLVRLAGHARDTGEAVTVRLVDTFGTSEPEFVMTCHGTRAAPKIHLHDDEVLALTKHNYLSRIDKGDHSAFREPCTVYGITDRMVGDMDRAYSLEMLRVL